MREAITAVFLLSVVLGCGSREAEKKVKPITDQTLVIDVTDQVPDTWLDSSGNHHSDQLRVVERYTAVSENHIMYEATIEDPEVYTEPWTISLPLFLSLIHI